MEYRPVWAEVHLNRIAENVAALAEAARPAELMAVVKANGYGHGAVAVAKVALASGAKRLAVASPEEGRELRRAGIAAPILVLGALLPGQSDVYCEYRLTATVASPEAVDEAVAAAQRRGNPLRVHVKVDTGMGRLGLLPEEVPRAVSALRRADRVELEGLYSHLACADSDGHDDVTAQQIDAFRRVLAACARAGWRPEIVHLANTAATLRRLAPPECNLARVGLGIYGLYPSDALAGAVCLSPALELKTRVTTVKRVPAGSGVSYGHTYHTGTETTLCTLPVGYADGLRRNLSGRVDALIKGRRHPIVGRICMDQCVVDVGDADVEVGDEAVLIGRQGNAEIRVEEWARKLDTISYELVCGISCRVPRLYVGGVV